MKVKELKQLHPIEDVTELNPDARYLIRVSPSIDPSSYPNIARTLRLADIKAVLFVGGQIQFYELSE